MRHIAILRDAFQSRHSILISCHIRQHLWPVFFYPRQGPVHIKKTIIIKPLDFCPKDCQQEVFQEKFDATLAAGKTTSFFMLQ
jgi:hypothetical protein